MTEGTQMICDKEVIFLFNELAEEYTRNIPVIKEINFVKKIFEKYKENYSYKLFQIKNNKLYLVCNEIFENETRLEAAKSQILNLLNEYNLPDMEFIYFDGDELSTQELILVSTSCASEENQILIPDFMFEFSPNCNLFNYEKDLEKIINKANENGTIFEKWIKRSEKVFYRGSLNSNYRKSYGILHDDLNFDFKHVSTLNADIGFPNFIISETYNSCSREYKSNFKYQLHLNGHEDCAYSSAFRFALACCSLVFYATEKPYKEWWMNEKIFKNYKHYIKVSSPQELIKKYEYFLQNNLESFNIALNGFNFVLKYLKKEHIRYYYYRILCEYSKNIKYKIELHPSAKLITSYKKYDENNKTIIEYKK